MQLSTAKVRSFARAVSIVGGLVAAATMASAQEPPREGPRTSLHQAQTSGASTEPRIEVASVILVAPASEVTLSITVVPQSAIPPQSFVRIRGLPPTAALSDGHAIQPGAWAVPLSALSNLRIIVPAGLSGKREVTISLVTGDGATLAEAKAALVIAAAGLITTEEKPSPPQAMPSPPPPLIAEPAPVVPPPAPPAAPAPAVASPLPSASVAMPATPAPVAAPTPPPPTAPVPAAAPPPPSASVATPVPPAPVATPAPVAAPASPPPAAPVAKPPPAPVAVPLPPAAAPAKQPAPQPPVIAALPPPEPAIAAKPKGPQPMAPEVRRRAEEYLDRAGKLLRDGDIASARLFLRRAADEGLAEAALAMGGTFDGDELARLRAHGIRPDPVEARRWYERAAELGSGEAQDRLKRLGAR